MSRMTASKAMRLYPPLRCTLNVVDMDAGEGWETGIGRALAKARKQSRIKDEKEVNDPQYPTVMPMYSGMAFFTARCRLTASCFCAACTYVRKAGSLSLTLASASFSMRSRSSGEMAS